MEIAGVQIDPQQLIETAAVLGGLGLTGVFGFLLVRRARAARLRQIEGIGTESPAIGARRGGQPRIRPEEDEDDDSRDDAAEGEPGQELQPERDDDVEDGGLAAHKGESIVEPDLRSRADRPVLVPPAPAVQPTKPPASTPVVPGRDLRFPKPQLPVEKPFSRPEPARESPKAPQVIPLDAGPPPESAPKLKNKDVGSLAPGLARTRSGWVSRLGQLFAGKREIDPALLDEVEKVLLTADIGVRTSDKLLQEMRASLSRKELNDPESAWAYLRRRTTQLLSWDAPPVRWEAAHPFVLLIIGVNGSGKTTTIGKLAAKLIGQGKKVLVGAGDTFRAAAAEQLEIWANRVGATVVRGKEGADPSSVLFDAVKRARLEGFDVVIADTAGRLHTKTDLMEELQKIRRVIGKATDGAPHETWLVIDSTNGQNAIAQAQIFTQAMSVSGIVLTKLDGTAKGGVILGIADQLQIPVRFVGIGERVEDLREFDADEFVDALYQQ
jgi:fused signal recognition particle receptor